jgi:hypothetical protein
MYAVYLYITRNSAYACWLSRHFNDHCVDRGLDDGLIYFWYDSVFFLVTRSSITRGQTRSQVSRCSTNDFMLEKVLGSLWQDPHLMSRIFKAGHCIYFHSTSNMCKVRRYLYLIICCDDAIFPIPVDVYFIKVLVTRVLCLQLGECFRIRGRQSYYSARNTTRLAQVACLHAHEADRERCFEIFSKTARRVTN